MKCRQSCLKIISPGDREANMLAKQKEEMGAPLNKREKQAKAGIENIIAKVSFRNDLWCAVRLVAKLFQWICYPT